MKRILVAITVGMFLTATIPSMAQHHRHTPATSITAKSHSNNKAIDTTAVVAFSDTTTNADDADTLDIENPLDDEMDEWNEISTIFKDTVMPIALVLIIFCLMPLTVIGLLIYFIIKTRNQKLRIMELAMKSGQPIPDELIRNKSTDKTLWNKGMLKIFIGVGIFMLGIFVSFRLIMGIGFLVMFYGAGQLVISYTSKRNAPTDTKDNTNDLSQNNEKPE